MLDTTFVAFFFTSIEHFSTAFATMEAELDSVMFLQIILYVSLRKCKSSSAVKRLFIDITLNPFSAGSAETWIQFEVLAGTSSLRNQA